MEAPKVVFFDLDDTLAESFHAPSPRIIELLGLLLHKVPVAISTAAGWPRIEEQFLAPMKDSVDISRLYIFPNSSAECYTHENGAWTLMYDYKLLPEERARIKEAIETISRDIDIRHPDFIPEVIDREAQIAYAVLGLGAPLEVKKSWDPDQSKRNLVKHAIESYVPNVEVRIGGMTSIDITKSGVNKATGVLWLSKHLTIPTTAMLFIGDALYPGGNDEVVIPTGIQTRSTSGPIETEKIIEEILSTF